MVESGTDDASLLAHAASGSEHAFRTLYRSYVRPVYWLAHGLVGNAADAEDVTQETFLVAWRKLRGLEWAGDSLLPWLVTVCRFQAANRAAADELGVAHGVVRNRLSRIRTRLRTVAKEST